MGRLLPHFQTNLIATLTNDAAVDTNFLVYHTLSIALKQCLILYLLSWQKQHQYLEKLNMQALLNATEEKTDYIQEALINSHKVDLKLGRFSD